MFVSRCVGWDKKKFYLSRYKRDHVSFDLKAVTSIWNNIIRILMGSQIRLHFISAGNIWGKKQKLNFRWKFHIKLALVLLMGFIPTSWKSVFISFMPFSEGFSEKSADSQTLTHFTTYLNTKNWTKF